MRVDRVLAACAALMIVLGPASVEAKGRGGGSLPGGVLVIPASASATPTHRTAPRAEHDDPATPVAVFPAIARAGTGTASTVTGSIASGGVRPASEQVEAKPREWCPSQRMFGSGVGFCKIN